MYLVVPLYLRVFIIYIYFYFYFYFLINYNTFYFIFQSSKSICKHNKVTTNHNLVLLYGLNKHFSDFTLLKEILLHI